MDIYRNLTDILISWGITGFILVAYVWCLLLKQSAKYATQKWKILAFSPALVAFIGTLAGQYLYTGYPHMRLCFLILAVKAFEEQNVQKQNIRCMEQQNT